MRLEPDQLEWIVREVVRRLHDTVSSGSHPSAGRAGEGGQCDQSSSHLNADLTVPDRIVTVSHLDGKLNGVARLHVARRAVVTPAARDLLKERGVELVRGEQP
jgi:hypothetical protein